MDIVDELLAGNADFVANKWEAKEGTMPGRPAKELAILGCMDTRYSIEKVLGLQHGDAKIIRNAGAVLDDGALRSLIVGIHALGVKHIVVLAHTKCGMTGIGQGDYTIAHNIADATDVPLHDVMAPKFHTWLSGFPDPEAQVSKTVQQLRGNPFIPADVSIAGMIYDNDTGNVRRVTAAVP